MGITKYIKLAFRNRWNLLGLGGGVVLALLSPHIDAVLALVAACELGYLGFVGTHPKFQRYIDIQEAEQKRSSTNVTSQQMLAKITKMLPRESMARFEDLQKQCLELKQIADELRHPATAADDFRLEGEQMSGLDKLLWIYLRLLYTQFALGRFLQKTSEAHIQSDIADLEKALAKMPDEKDAQKQRMRAAIQDNLQTSRGRLANLNRAKDNYTLVKLELDRLENKIRSLSEMAVNRQEPEFISGQVDQVANSMVDTEKTMNELQFITGLDAPQDDAPMLLRAKVAQ